MTPTSVRHRVGIRAGRRRPRRRPRRCRTGSGAAGDAGRLAFYVVDGAHRRLADAQTARRVSRAAPRSAARSPARRSRISAGCWSRCCKFSTLTSRRHARARGVRRRGSRARGLAAGNGVLIFSGHFGFWELQGLVHPLRSAADVACWRARSTTRSSTGCSSGCGAHRQPVIYRRARSAASCARSQANDMRRRPDRPAHPDADAVTSTSSTARRRRRRRWRRSRCAPARRSCPVFALPLGGGRYRMIYEHPVEPPAADRARPGPRVHAALHRRAGDVRPPPSGAVAVDAPPVARRGARRREGARGMFPSAAPEEGEESLIMTDPPSGSRVVVRAAELAGRRRDGAAGDGRGARHFSARAPDGRSAAGVCRGSFARTPTRVRTACVELPETRRRRRRRARRRAGSRSASCFRTRSGRRGSSGAPACPSAGDMRRRAAAGCSRAERRSRRRVTITTMSDYYRRSCAGSASPCDDTTAAHRASPRRAASARGALLAQHGVGRDGTARRLRAGRRLRRGEAVAARLASPQLTAGSCASAT